MPLRTPDRQSDDPVYDKKGTDNSGFNEIINANYSPEELDARESAGSSGAEGASAVSRPERGFFNDDSKKGGPASPLSGLPKKLAKKLLLRKRNTVIGGGVVGLIAGVLVFMFTIGVGPLKMIHLSQLLQKDFFGTEQSTKHGMRGLLRYARTGNIGETRVTALGSKIQARVTKKLEAQGYKFDGEHRNPISGHLRSMGLDTSKHDIFNKIPAEERAAAMAKHFPKGTEIKRVGRTNNYIIKVDPTNKTGMNLANLIVERIILDLQNGRMATGMNKRVFKRFHNQSSMYNPPLRKANQVQNALAESLPAKQQSRKEAREEARQRGELRFQRLQESPVGVKAAKAKADMKNLVNKNRVALASALTITFAACVVRDYVAIGPAADRLDAAKVEDHAEHLKAVGDKTRAGGNVIEAGTLGGEADTLVDDKGQDIFAGRAMQELSGKAEPSGPDLAEEDKRVFREESYSEFRGIANSVGDAACAPASLAAQGALGVFIIFTTGPAGGAALTGAKLVGSAAVTTAVLTVAMNDAQSRAEDKVKFELGKGGAREGNLIAHANRSSANGGARVLGGSALSKEESLSLEKEQRLASQKEFQSKNFASRMFDVYDHRSMAGGLIDDSSTSPGQNISNLASSLMNAGSSLASSLLGTFSPQVLAAEEPYDWGMPRYGISKKLLDDPRYDDPSDNAEKAAQLFKSGQGGYLDRAKKCFGVKINNDSGKWLATVEEEVNPQEIEYQNAKCNEYEENWNRVTLFVFYDRLVTIVACYDGDEEACDELGMSGGGGQESSDSQPAAAGNADLKKNITVDTEGKFITMPSKYSCSGRTTKIDSRIAASLAYLLTTYNMCADDGLASGHKSHGAGLGVDIRPKDQSKQNSKDEWKKTVEAAARDMGWTGDAADKPKGSEKGCAPAYSGYGNCVGGSGEIPKWVRWIGYNGDVDHGDPWHIFGGSYAHIHIGWASPNGGDAVSPGVIGSPIPEVYTFPAPIPDDLKDLL